MNNPTIILIADYGTGDPSFIEVMLQLQSLLPGAHVLPQSVPAFSTLNTGFWTYQFAMTKNLKNTFIYSNTAPRAEEKEAQKNNRGEKLTYAKLKNGFEVIGVNAKYVFSFIKPYIKEFCLVNVENEGSQFRSRDKFPVGVARMIQEDGDFKGESLDISLIPDVPIDTVASVDGYGNIKTTTRLSQTSFTPGQNLKITINNKAHDCVFTDGTFNIRSGQIAFAPGSSGHEDKFMEIFHRGGNASILFDNVHVETPFTIQAA